MKYWEERQIETYKAGEMQVNHYFSRLEKAFNQTRRELQKTVELFYFRYAEENGLSYAAAQKRLNAAEVGELRDFIELAVKNIGKHNQTVNNLSIKARITRYQALEAQIDAMLRQLYAIDYQSAAGQTMQEVYAESYYRTWYNIDQYRGVHSSFALVAPQAVETLLEYPFNGANFSSRLWKQKDHLQTQLMEALTTMMVQGKNPKAIAGDFAKKMNSKKFDAYRLLQTESSFLISEATHAGYKEDGVERYEILATLDSKTCGICGDKDGEVHAVDKAIVGDNMPPFHCFCRCTDTPHYDDMDLSDMTRVAREPETGKYVKVPADMTYKEWKETYVNLESDGLIRSTKKKMKETVVDSKIVSFQELPQNMTKGFDEGLMAANQDVALLLRHELSDTDFYISGGPKSEYLKGINAVGIAEDSEASTIAHELFHKIDMKYTVTKQSSMIKSFTADYNQIGDVTVELQRVFPEAFELIETGKNRLKAEYRGVSDIVSALSKGEVNLGYGHSKKYWNKYDGIQMQEIWAQYGRIYFENDPDVIHMTKTLFPTGSQRVNMKIRRLVKNVER